MEQTFEEPKRVEPNLLVAALKRPGPPGGIRATNRQQKSQRIRDAALALFLARGIEDVSVEDIMLSSELAKGSFYRYFEDQEGLVAELIAPLADQVTTALKACAVRLRAAPGSDAARREAFQRLVTALTRVLAEHRGPLQLYLQENHGPSVGARRPIIELMTEICQLGMDLDAAIGARSPVLVFALVGATERVLLSIAHGQPAPEPATLSAALLTVLGAIRPSDATLDEAGAGASQTA